MATRRRSQLSSYRTYGSVAYAPAYDGTAVRAPRREEVLRPSPGSAPGSGSSPVPRSRSERRGRPRYSR